MKIKKLEQKEEFHERKEKAEEQRRALNGEEPNKQRSRPLALDIMSSTIDALHLLSFTRDKLTMESLEIELELDTTSDLDTRRANRLQSQIGRLNRDIEAKVTMNEGDFNALANAQFIDNFTNNNNNDEEDTSNFNVTL